jgi:hypothetical protein
MNEQSISEVGGEPPVTPDAPRRLADQVQTTDVALRAWREESVRRRAAYEAHREELAAASRVWWRRTVRRTGVAFAAGGVMGLTIAYLIVRDVPASPPVAEITAEVPLRVEEPTVIAAPIAEPVVEVTTSALRGEPAVTVVPGSSTAWKDTGYHWVRFEVEENELVRIAWRDGAGTSVLEPMQCGSPGNGIRSCLAGRSHERIAHAIDQGASAGTWTVEACGTGGCVPVTTFEAP